MICRQKGVALISVLLVFAIITILVGQLLTRSQSDIERTRWLVNEAQGFQIALAGEALARQILWRQHDNLTSTDTNISPIPNLLPIYRPEYGELAIEIVDLQGRINLNNIAAEGVARLPVEKIFTEVLSRPMLINALADWVDSDFVPRQGGGEDFSYYTQVPPYRTGNRALANPTELRALGDLAADKLQFLEAYLSTLVDVTPVNLNTAPAEVISLLDPDISGQKFVNYRDGLSPGFASVQEFLDSDIAEGLVIDPALLTVTSSNYAVKIITILNGQKFWLHSHLTINNDNGSIALQARTIGEPFAINTLPANGIDSDDSTANTLL
jgi:general secretion pathway protein K